MSRFASISALLASLMAALVLMFVWGGTDQISITWKAMDDDQSHGAFVARRVPAAETVVASTTVMEAPEPVRVRANNSVLWINISGMRADYFLDDSANKAETPFMDSLAQKGSHTQTMQPVFPSLTYPCLVTQATGVGVDKHGVVSDTIRDPASKAVAKWPTDLALMKAEPIWTTAKRQGLRVLVHDWPFSQKQPAEHAADIFQPEFDPALTDEDRLNRLFDAWVSDKGETKLRLVMANLQGLEKAVHDYGCRENETFKEVEKLDATLKAFFEKLEKEWPKLGNPNDDLYVFITSDHGMADAKKLINFKVLMGKLADEVDYTADEVVAHVWFKDPPAGKTKDQFMKEFDEELNARIYWRTYKPESFPADWHYTAGNPEIGDRVLVLKAGYALTDKTGTEAVFDPGETAGPFACSGFQVVDSSRMQSQAVFFKLTNDSGSGSDLGDVKPTQLHATVCELLDIKPADGADTNALRLPN